MQLSCSFCTSLMEVNVSKMVDNKLFCNVCYSEIKISDEFLTNILEANKHQEIIDDNLEHMNSELTEDIISEAEDTLTILNKYVDGLKTDDIDSVKLKNILKELYIEALNLENS